MLYRDERPFITSQNILWGFNCFKHRLNEGSHIRPAIHYVFPSLVGETNRNAVNRVGDSNYHESLTLHIARVPHYAPDRTRDEGTRHKALTFSGQEVRPT